MFLSVRLVVVIGGGEMLTFLGSARRWCGTLTRCKTLLCLCSDDDALGVGRC